MSSLLTTRKRARAARGVAPRSHCQGAFRGRHPIAYRGVRSQGRISDCLGSWHHLRDPGLDLSDCRAGTDYRVIAFDHRGHGRSGHSAARKLQPAVTSQPMSTRCSTAPWHRASVPSSPDIRWAAWPSPHGRIYTATRSTSRADAVALVNTTTGDLLREVRLLSVPAPLAAARILGGRALIDTFGSFAVPPLAGARGQPE